MEPKQNVLKEEWLQILILVLPFIIAAIVWPRLPDRIPSHWNAHGEIDSTMPKGIGILILPLVNIGVTLLLWGVGHIDPKLFKTNIQSAGGNAANIKPIRLLVSTFLLVLFLITLYITLGGHVDMERVPVYLIFALLGGLGFYMPKVKPNYFVGIRDPWSLEDPEIWQKTHAFTGKFWPVLAVVGIIAEFVMPSIIWLFVGIGLFAFVPIFYSFLQFREKKKLVK